MAGWLTITKFKAGNPESQEPIVRPPSQEPDKMLGLALS